MRTDGLQQQLQRSLEREVEKGIARYNKGCRDAHRDARRFAKRTGQIAVVSKDAMVPSHWTAGNLFDPFYVKKRLDNIAHALASKIRNLEYKPNPSLVISIPKPTGGTRNISIFTIPDAAVAYWLNEVLLKRNQAFFSSYCFAYRNDRNGHNAINHLISEIRQNRRLYTLEYDFSKYFDSIDHSYLMEILKAHLRVSPREIHLIDSFLNREYATSISNLLAGKVEISSVGVPQGSSISLFLANVASLELDRRIERIGVAFARYADDTVILCENYENASRCAKAMLEHGTKSGTEINFSKSAGISLLSPDNSAEMRCKKGLTFLSHYLSFDGVYFSEKAIRSFKKRVSRIIYNNLLLYLKQGKFNTRRVGPMFFDWDLVSCINELRRYIYGKITEKELTDGLAGNASFKKTFCALSFYPTVDRGNEQMRQLDGWLVDVLERALKYRYSLIRTITGAARRRKAPDRNRIIDGTWYTFSYKIPHETKLPSFFKSWLYTRKSVTMFDLSSFPTPPYNYA